jgi:hypothetical protein
LSNGDGTFRPSGNLAIGTGTVALIAENWDDDGWPDLAVLNAIDGAVTILSNGLAMGSSRPSQPSFSSRPSF